MELSKWEIINDQIALLEPVCQKEEEKIGVPNCKEAVWRLKATKALPPGVFMWRDNFELLWQAYIATFTPDKRYCHR